MGKNSRNKKNRTSLPPPRLYRGVGWLSWSTIVFVGGVLMVSYGLAAMQYSRWDHRHNATVHPVFHPWAIAIGIILIYMSIRKSRKERM